MDVPFDLQRVRGALGRGGDLREQQFRIASQEDPGKYAADLMSDEGTRGPKSAMGKGIRGEEAEIRSARMGRFLQRCKRKSSKGKWAIHRGRRAMEGVQSCL